MAAFAILLDQLCEYEHCVDYAVSMLTWNGASVRDFYRLSRALTINGASTVQVTFERNVFNATCENCLECCIEMDPKHVFALRDLATVKLQRHKSPPRRLAMEEAPCRKSLLPRARRLSRKHLSCIVVRSQQLQSTLETTPKAIFVRLKAILSDLPLN